MSAETKFGFYRMENGELWITVNKTADNSAESHGVDSIVARCGSYEEAVRVFDKISDPDSDQYIYTEYGGDLPNEDSFMSMRPCFLCCEVSVRVDGRECNCFDARDLEGSRWMVVEGYDFDNERIVGQGLTYAQAVTLAYVTSRDQPGKVTRRVPEIFRTFKDYPGHDCYVDNECLALPF